MGKLPNVARSRLNVIDKMLSTIWVAVKKRKRIVRVAA